MAVDGRRPSDQADEHAVPFSVKEAGTPFVPAWAALNPKFTAAPGAMEVL
jgi:hypothetical protein